MKKTALIILILFAFYKFDYAQEGSSFNGNLFATVSNQTLLEIRTPQNLRCNIHVDTHEKQSVEASYRVWAKAKSAEQENRFIKLIETKIDENYEKEGVVRIRILAPTMAPWEGTNYGIGADLNIQVPKYFEIDSRSMYGDVIIKGPLSVAKVDCEYGSVNVDDVDNETNVKASYSHVDVHRLKGYVNVEAAFSDIVADHIDILESTGIFQSSNGEITLQNITGPVEVATSNKNITAHNLVAYNAEFSSGYIVLRTSYGSIDAAVLKGEVVAETNYGTIALDSVYMPYGMSKFETKYAPIDVRIAEIGDAQLLVNNTYSSISLNVPEDISSKLVLTVDQGGKIHTRGLSIKPLVMESNRLVGLAGEGAGRIEANVDGIGEINIQGR
jgi:hypothetical protein